jgi:hypothetical protein
VDITTPSVYEHEIAKHDDFQYGFESIIRNTAVLDRMLVSSETYYIVGGIVTQYAAVLGIHIGKTWGNGLTLDVPVFNDTVSDVVLAAAAVSDRRVDTVQVRAVMEEYDTQRRAFFNPETESGQYFPTPTKKRLRVECGIKQGIEGQDVAPAADAGWLKLAELVVEPGASTFTEEDIKGVTAIYQGEENTEWTAERTRTFDLGSTLELKTILAKEHTVSGEHRAKVIKAVNIDFGTGAGQVSAKNVPLGEEIKIGTDEFNALDSVYAALVKEVGYRRTNIAALAQAIAIINGTIAAMVQVAPDDGGRYGRKNKSWYEIVGGGGGALGDAIEAFKFYSKKTIMFTNARIVDRRMKAWDIGLPYLSAAHEVYHFDTDNNNQNQESNITINSQGDAPVLVGKDDFNGQLYFNPAVSELPPFEMLGKSIYGQFSVSGQITGQSATLEFWARMLMTQDVALLRFGAPAQDEIVLNIGGTDPELSAPAEGDPPASVPAISDSLPCSVPEETGNRLYHNWASGDEFIDLDAEGVVITEKTWLHLAAVVTPETVFFYIGTRQFSFTRNGNASTVTPFTINEDMNELNLDELSLIHNAAEPLEAFAENTAGRVPFAGLNYLEKFMVVMADDPEKVKTNLFDGEDFKSKVLEIIGNQ